MVVGADLEDLPRVHVLGRGDLLRVEDRPPLVGPPGDQVVVGGPEGPDELPRHAVEDHAPPGLVRVDEHPPGLAALDEVEEHALVRGVHVPVVLGDDLEVPAHLPRPDVEGEYRVGEERIASPPEGGRPGDGLARAHVDEAELWVVADRVPCRAAERRERALRPALGSGLSPCGHGEDAPEKLPRLGLVRRHIAPGGPVTPGEPQDDLSVGDEGGMAVALSRAEVSRLPLPAHLPRLGVERHQVGVGRAPVDHVPVEGDATVAGVCLGALDILREGPLVDPGDIARLHLQRDHPAAPLGDVHEAVGHDGSGDPPAVVAHRIRPDEAEISHVFPADPLERAVSCHIVGPPVAQPVPVPGLEEPLPGDRLPPVLLRVQRRGREEDGDRRQDGKGGVHCAKADHRELPLESSCRWIPIPYPRGRRFATVRALRHAPPGCSEGVLRRGAASGGACYSRYGRMHRRRAGITGIRR